MEAIFKVIEIVLASLLCACSYVLVVVACVRCNFNAAMLVWVAIAAMATFVLRKSIKTYKDGNDTNVEK